MEKPAFPVSNPWETHLFAGPELTCKNFAPDETRHSFGGYESFNFMNILVILVLLISLSWGGCVSRRSNEQETVPHMPPTVAPLPVVKPIEGCWKFPSWWNGTTGATCLVHSVARIEDTVPVRYGFPGTSDKECSAAEVKYFPNTWHYVGGGCCFEVGRSPTEEVVRYCPECRRLEAAWLEQRARRKAEGDVFCERYVVRKNETLYGIARKHKDRDTLQGIIARNSILEPDRIVAGQILYIRR